MAVKRTRRWRKGPARPPVPTISGRPRKSFEKTFPAGVFAGPKTVVVDGNIITASAMGQALPFALAVLGDIAGEVAVEKVREGIQLDGPVA